MEDYRESNSFDDVNMERKNVNIVYKPDDIPKESIKSESLANDAAVPGNDGKFQSTDDQPKSKIFDSEDLSNSTDYGIMRWTVTSSSIIPLVKIEETLNIESIDFETEPQKEKLGNDKCSISNDHTAHQSAHKADNLFKCDVCNKEFTQLGTLRIHHKILHSGTKTYVCKICGELCSDQPDLDTHQLSHTGAKPHMCTVYSKKFIAAEELAQHRITHAPEKAFKCDICGKGFFDNSTLSDHLRTHSSKKPYKCNVCKKKCAQPGTLRRHQLIHLDEKRYNCNVCDKNFANKRSCKIHQRIHTGEIPYECEVCNKEFTQASGLREHQRIHTGEIPYKCDVCHEEFTNLRIHLKSLHHRREASILV